VPRRGISGSHARPFRSGSNRTSGSLPAAAAVARAADALHPATRLTGPVYAESSTSPSAGSRDACSTVKYSPSLLHSNLGTGRDEVCEGGCEAERGGQGRGLPAGIQQAQGRRLMPQRASGPSVSQAAGPNPAQPGPAWPGLTPYTPPCSDHDGFRSGPEWPPSPCTQGPHEAGAAVCDPGGVGRCPLPHERMHAAGSGAHTRLVSPLVTLAVKEAPTSASSSPSSPSTSSSSGYTAGGKGGLVCERMHFGSWVLRLVNVAVCLMEECRPLA
jgi:hypothetical protein